jgi:5-oxoprolinase (ATP-hydrolysing) subunit A
VSVIDLNADLGEAFGRWTIPGADDVLALVSSASIACGAHAGDPVVMRATVRAARARGVVVGAHPGYPDLAGFGRRELGLDADEIAAQVAAQTGALAGIARLEGAAVRYVKPHGALYNRAVRDAAAARAIVDAVRGVDQSLVLLALAGSEMIRAAEGGGLRVAREAFVDRAYRADGSLLPRGEPGAVLHDPSRVADRALRLVEEGRVETADGETLRLQADSLCVHGDSPGAPRLVGAVRERLERAGIRVAPFVGGDD